MSLTFSGAISGERSAYACLTQTAAALRLVVAVSTTATATSFWCLIYVLWWMHGESSHQQSRRSAENTIPVSMVPATILLVVANGALLGRLPIRSEDSVSLQTFSQTVHTVRKPTTGPLCLSMTSVFNVATCTNRQLSSVTGGWGSPSSSTSDSSSDYYFIKSNFLFDEDAMAGSTTAPTFDEDAMWGWMTAPTLPAC